MANNKKSYRVGERNTNRQGLTMEIVKYFNNKKVEIVFLETGEHKFVRYINFCNRNVKADLQNHPYIIVREAKKAVKGAKVGLAIASVVTVIIILTSFFL